MFKKTWIFTIVALCTLAFSFPEQSSAHANVYTVQKGDSLYKIAMKYGAPLKQVMAMNNKDTAMIYPGEQVKIPVHASASEQDLLSRLVEAEAKGESYAGKVAVATVVLNRVESDRFPDSIKGVIYDGKQFSPVLNGSINQSASHESKRAVKEALAYQGYDNESLFFYNPDKAQSEYLRNKEVTTVIGNHYFLR
ncbi:cell wall hydrolase [Pontibacillus yanchengensis]|uniref:Peptidoglycan-binding protein n=1 Tax=Pontibacillus yanchengensis Y32 TaxID=1385514 RepID=A0A0A2TVL6_9BACI|nr:cell wall hydrolase [Pontibacillus yanchengensis]KGP73310.1 peptidoglycan-binding protein [Pontibacillus yanchengensis Y32]